MNKKAGKLLPIVLLSLFCVALFLVAAFHYSCQQFVSLTAPRSSPLVSQADSPLQEGKINVNTATADMLTQLPGIGDVLSQRIVAYRQEHGPYKTIEDLINVKGIGNKLLEKISDYITIGEPYENFSS